MSYHTHNYAHEQVEEAWPLTLSYKLPKLSCELSHCIIMCKKRRRKQRVWRWAKVWEFQHLATYHLCHELFCKLPKVLTKCIHASIQHIMELIMLKIQAQFLKKLVTIVRNSYEPSSIGLFQLFSLVRFILRFKLLSQLVYLGVI